MMIFLSTVESVLEITSVEFVESGMVILEVVVEALTGETKRKNKDTITPRSFTPFRMTELMFGMTEFVILDRRFVIPDPDRGSI